MVPERLCASSSNFKCAECMKNAGALELSSDYSDVSLRVTSFQGVWPRHALIIRERGQTYKLLKYSAWP